MPITIILKDEDGMPVIDALTGRRVQSTVNDAVAVYLEENASEMKRLKHIDERNFGLLHFDKRAWENMQGLTPVQSAEDNYLDVLEEIAAVEHAQYLARLDLCRQLLPLVREACTATQWRRYMLHRYCGFTIREIAQMEGCHQKPVHKAIKGAEKKIKKIFSEFARKS